MAAAKLRFSIHLSPNAPDDELLFARQLGVPCVYTWVPSDQTDVDSLRALREKVEAAGLELWMVGDYRLGKNPDIILATPQRDAEIAKLQQFIRNLGAAGIRTTTFTWEQDQVWSSAERGESRGALARRVDVDELYARGLTHGRAYSEAEIWDNFAYYLRAVIPVAEEAGVRLALHPNDPPVEQLGGVPCLIHSWADYRRAFELAGSPALGMEFCTGCWLEGGAAFGDLLAGLRWCVEQGRVFIVHFRNVSSPLPSFTETFLDNGYQDMYQAMRVLVETGYDGTVCLDHSPAFVASQGKGSGTAYAIGYMRALLAVNGDGARLSARSVP
jgi:mannonate dehydratase